MKKSAPFCPLNQPFLFVRKVRQGIRRLEAHQGCKQRAKSVVFCRSFWRMNRTKLFHWGSKLRKADKIRIFFKNEIHNFGRRLLLLVSSTPAQTFLFKQATGRWAEPFRQTRALRAKCKMLFFTLSPLWNFLQPGLGECFCTLLKVNEAHENAKLWSDCACVSALLHRWEAVNRGLNMLI